MAREVRIQILGDARDFSRAVDVADRDASRLDGAFGRVSAGAGRMAGAVALGVAGVAVAGGAMALSFIQAAEEAQRVTRQTDAVLESMGATSWITAGQVEALAGQLSNLTGIDDEVIQSGQNVMLTFGNVRNQVGEGRDIFNRATAAALDMSVALGTDMNNAAMMVGKALNDPIRGLTALRRSGIQFTEQQEDQIRTMVASGDVIGAQTIMLAELERQFGGSAEAQSTASQRLSTMWENLKETIGEMLLPYFEKIVDWLIEKLPIAIWHGTIWFNKLKDAVAAVVDWVREHWPEIKKKIEEVLDQIQQVIDDFITDVKENWKKFHDDITVTAEGNWTGIKQRIEGALYAIKGVIDTVMGIMSGDWSRVWDGIMNIAKANWAFIQGNIAMVIGTIRGIVGAGVEFIRTTMADAWRAIVDQIRQMPGRIGAAASGMFDGIKNAFRSAINTIIGWWNGLEFHFDGFDIPGPGPNIPGFTIGTPTIPRLHTGGIFQAPGGAREGLALLESGERVIPANQSGGEALHLTLVVDGQVLTDSLVRQARMGNNIVVQLGA